MIYTDQHIHCQCSPDSHTPLREMAAAARDHGMSAVCFTDHIDMDFGNLGDLRWEARKDILRAAWPDIQCAADMEEASALLEDAIYEAHRQIFYLAESIGERTGSTLSVLFLKGRMYRIKQIGDSRIYCVRRGKIEQLTVDQTWCNMMVQTGQLDEEQAAHHRMRHFLVNALGVSQELEIADEQGTVRGGECYLLCSDGFYNEAAVENVPEILYRQNLAQALEELLSDVLRGQARDNVSVVACAVSLL